MIQIRFVFCRNNARIVPDCVIAGKLFHIIGDAGTNATSGGCRCFSCHRIWVAFERTWDLVVRGNVVVWWVK